MAVAPLRFIHAADFHLDQPLFGFSDLPPALAEQCIDAPYIAAQRVFDVAVERRVEFVALCGDLLDLRLSDPRAISFLLEQFARLDAEQINIYWATGSRDAATRWPRGVALPASVRRLPADDVAVWQHVCRNGREVTLLGSSGPRNQRIVPAKWKVAEDERTSIAVVRGAAEPRGLSKTNVNYWALGGSHQRRTSGSETARLHHPGAPQGRCPKEHGPHGCTLVEVDDQQMTHLKPLDTDVVRYTTLKVRPEESLLGAELRQVAADRLFKKIENPHRPALLVTWSIVASAIPHNVRDRHALTDDLLTWLREQFADARPAAWSIAAHWQMQDALSEPARDDPSIWGDFLAIIRQYSTEAEVPSLQQYVPADLKQRLASAAGLSGETEREYILREAAALGAALLRGPRAA